MLRLKRTQIGPIRLGTWPGWSAAVESGRSGGLAGGGEIGPCPARKVASLGSKPTAREPRRKIGESRGAAAGGARRSLARAWYKTKDDYMTQFERARQGEITAEVQRIAQAEGVAPESLRASVAAGRAVAPGQRPPHARDNRAASARACAPRSTPTSAPRATSPTSTSELAKLARRRRGRRRRGDGPLHRRRPRRDPPRDPRRVARCPSARCPSTRPRVERRAQRRRASSA